MFVFSTPIPTFAAQATYEQGYVIDPLIIYYGPPAYVYTSSYARYMSSDHDDTLTNDGYDDLDFRVVGGNYYHQDDNTLSYSWSSTIGSLSDYDGPTSTWTVPSYACSGYITLTCDDDGSYYDDDPVQKTLSVTVVKQYEALTAITDVAISSSQFEDGDTVYSGQTYLIQCNVCTDSDTHNQIISSGTALNSHTDSDTIKYSWSVTNGTLLDLNDGSGGNYKLWTPSTTASSTDITITVHDDYSPYYYNDTNKSDSITVNLFHSNILYVDKNATSGDDDGSSWANAFNDLQDALDLDYQGVEIWIADSTYTPGTSRSDSFILPTTVNIYGGFEGFGGAEESSKWERDWVANPVVLSGEIGTSAATDNCYCVVTCDTTTTEFYIDGVIISDGYGAIDGAGMLATCAGVIKNTVFENNTTTTYGGGLRVEDAVYKVFLTNCIFNDNASAYGGAISSDDSWITAYNCLFVNNEASTAGGAIHFSHFHGIGIEKHLEMYTSTLAGNSAGTKGGAIAFNATLSSTIIAWFNSTIIWGNSATTGPNVDSYANDSDIIATFRYCDVEDGITTPGFSETEVGTGGATMYDVAGNIDYDPAFLDDTEPKGTDGLFFTTDDGFELTEYSYCIDAGDNDTIAHLKADITSVINRKIDDTNVTDTGNGTAPIIDIGAYEFGDDEPDAPDILVMCWINESRYGPTPPHETYYSDSDLYDEHLDYYIDNILPNFDVVSGCLVPNSTIIDVLPSGWPEPSDINVELFSMTPDRDDFIDAFYDLCDGVTPQYLLLTVDSSGSMSSVMLEPAYSNFIKWAKETYGVDFVKDTRTFFDQAWVNEISSIIEDNFE